MHRRAHSTFQLISLCAFTILVLYLGRPDQFLHPYIWVEDGTVNLKGYAERGFWSVFDPVAGYYILASKIIALAAFKASILRAPEIELVLVVAFTCFVVAAVALSPTHLPWPYLCAVGILLIPTDAEVFAVSLYAFWWAGILILLALLWDTSRNHDWLRRFYVVLGGLSSPIIVPVALLLALRAGIERNNREVVTLVIAVACSAIQGAAIYHSGAHTVAGRYSLPALSLAADKFAGYYFIGFIRHTLSPITYFGFAVIAILGVACWTVRRELNFYFPLIVASYALICVMTMNRNAIEILDSDLGGPRYFFYPYILLSWIIIWIAAKASALVRIGLFIALVFALKTAWDGMSRRHDTINWQANVKARARSRSYKLPIHYAGDARQILQLRLTGEQCRKLISDSLF